MAFDGDFFDTSRPNEESEAATHLLAGGAGLQLCARET